MTWTQWISARIAKYGSQSAAGARWGVKQQSVSAWESGLWFPSKPQQEALARKERTGIETIRTMIKKAKAKKLLAD